MKVTLVTPAPIGSRSGNRATAERWARLLRDLGHRVRVMQSWDGAQCDVLLALHAGRSHDSIRRFAQRHPDRPLVLALTGTDLYRDIRESAEAQESLRLASRFIVLQEMGVLELAPELHGRTYVVYQSARELLPERPVAGCFEVCVSGHLREEKDPFRTAAAIRHLPPSSRIRVMHLGRAMSDQMETEARAWMAREPNYQWRGELPHARALRLLARARLLVVSSRMEGGANVVSEALVARVPVIASRISGNVGMLGADYAGYYEVENEQALAALLFRAETDDDYYATLCAQCARRRPLFLEAAERESLRKAVFGVS